MSTGARLLATAALLLFVGAPAPLVAQSASPKAYSSRLNSPEPAFLTHYYDGDRKVSLAGALDELQLESQYPDYVAAHAKSLAQAETVQSTSGSAVRVRLKSPPADKAGLGAAAARLRQATGARRANAVLYPPGAPRSSYNRKVLTSRISVRLLPGSSPEALSRRYRLRLAKTITYSPDTYVFETQDPSPLAALEVANLLYETEDVIFAAPVLERLRTRRAAGEDPLFSSQWHLKNTGAAQQYQAVAANDIAAVPAWNTGLSGAGVVIGVVDDGLQLDHPDLSANVRSGLSLDLNDGDTDPTPAATSSDSHGTACAGVAAAARGNATGGSGVAPGAGLAGIRLISAPVTDEQEAEALLHQINAARPDERISISTNSWGPADDGVTLEGPGPLTRAAIARASGEGRGGLGTVFTWAAGNGRRANDDVNLDGYANDPHTIAVGATYADGTAADYSEPGVAMFVNAPSSKYLGSVPYGIITTDRSGTAGYAPGDYTPASGSGTFGGTSSAAPLAAGTIALMLQANPNLTWRDVQHILAASSTQNDPGDAGWITNAAGYRFNPKYGFGRINARAATDLARTWFRVAPQVEPLTATSNVPVAIPDDNTSGVSQEVSITASPFFRIEHVQVTLNATHSWRGDLEIYLTAPSGTTARLTGVRGGDSGRDFSSWTFLSLPTWGENPNGRWTLRVADRAAQDTGVLQSWTLKISGTDQPDYSATAFSDPGTGWGPLGTSTAQAWTDYDSATGALRAHVAPGSTQRVIGWRAVENAQMLPFTSLSAGSYVRATFSVYAGGQQSPAPDQVPNFRLRASVRFAQTSVLDVMHHSSTDPEGSRFATDFRPSTSPAAPSVYRVDFAPIEVPALRQPGSQEGVSRAFEAFSLGTEPQENGYVALTESSLEAYPAPDLLAPGALVKTYATEADFMNGFFFYTAKLDRSRVAGGDLDNATLAASRNGAPQRGPSGTPLPLLSSSEVAAGVSAAGVTLDTTQAGPDVIAISAADFLTGNAQDADLTKRVRVEPGKVYQLRFHATSTQPSSRNAHVRFRARTSKFLWTQRLEVGGAFGAGSQNNAIAQQMLPGIGSRNPDQRVPGEAGGWYTLLVHSPLAPEIRADAGAGTPLSLSMPNLASQPGPGENAPSRRDLFPGVDLLDTLSAGEHWLEQGQLTVDRIEIRQYDL